MGSLLLSLTPLALGALMSPLAVVAVVVVLLSRRPGANGVALLMGWLVGIVLVLVVGFFLAAALAGRQRSDPPLWVELLRVVIGVVLIGAGVVVWRRKQAAIRQMAHAQRPADVVAAAPQLPGFLKSVAEFQPGRCLLLGAALFVVNPVDFACALGAGVDIAVADVPTPSAVVATLLFIVVAILPIAVPVGVYLVQGQAADPFLNRLRQWIANNTTALNAGMLVLIGVIQLVKGLKGL